MLQLVPPAQTFRDSRTGETYVYTGPMQNIMGHTMPMFGVGSKHAAQYWIKSGADVNASGLGGGLNQGPRTDFNDLGVRVGPSMADIYGPAGVNYGAYQRPAPRPPGFMPRFDMQQVMQNIAARRATQGQGISGLPTQTLGNAPGPAGIAGLHAISRGPTP